MADGSAEENIQFSLEAIDLHEDIEMADELICNKDVEEDCVLSEEEISIFEIAKEETSVSIPPVAFIDEENITCVVVENKMNRRRCNKQSSITTTKSFTCEICRKISEIEKNLAKHYIICKEKHRLG